MDLHEVQHRQNENTKRFLGQTEGILEPRDHSKDIAKKKLPFQLGNVLFHTVI